MTEAFTFTLILFYIRTSNVVSINASADMWPVCAHAEHAANCQRYVSPVQSSFFCVILCFLHSVRRLRTALINFISRRHVISRLGGARCEQPGRAYPLWRVNVTSFKSAPSPATICPPRSCCTSSVSDRQKNKWRNSMPKYKRND